MSVRRWAYIAFGLFVLCGLGLAALTPAPGAVARVVPTLYTHKSGGLFNFDVEASIPLTTPTPFPTFTPVGTTTPSPTNLPPTLTPNANSCYVEVTEATTTCVSPDTYNYDFDLQRFFCNNLSYHIDLYLDVAIDIGGPWVNVAQQTITSTQALTIQGSFVENVAPQHRWYRIRITGYINATGRPFKGISATEIKPICGRPLPCPLSWNARAPYPIPVTDHTAAALGNYLYSFGGTSLNETSNAYRYDPSADSWTSILSMPGVRRGASAVSGNGYVYVVNGWSGSSANNTLFRYDPTTNTYTTLLPGLMATAYQTAALLNGKVYRIGGLDSSGNPTGSVEIYGEQMVAPLPHTLSSAAAMSMNGYIYVAGGVAPPGVITKTYRYDPVSNTWDDAAIADLPMARRGDASGVLDGKWVLAGGASEGSVVAWDPSTNTWLSLTPLLYDRSDMAGGVVGSAFYVAGGVDNTGPTTDTQQYVLDAGCASPTPVSPTAVTTSVSTITPTATSQSTSIATATISPVATATCACISTGTPTFTATPVQTTGTPTTCSINFIDVQADNTFYPYVRCLACREIVGGYADDTFRPNNIVTRGQVAKIVANSAGFNEPVTGQTFEDVLPNNSFYMHVERMSARGFIGGYTCGGRGEPCGTTYRPYFRPNANATRGQITKIVSNARGYNDPPGSQIFEDVPPGSAFYDWVQRLASRGIMGGYPCGSPGETCGTTNRPYFRPNNNATRGQMSKIVANTFFPGCDTP